MKDRSDISNKDNASNESGEKANIDVDLGSGLNAIPRNTKLPVILTVALAVSLSVLTYKYFNVRSETANTKTALAAKPKSFKARIPDENIDVARTLFSEKKFEESIAVYKDILKKSPKNVQALNDVGVLYLKKKKLAQSEAQLKKSVELAPDCVVCWNNLGYLKTLQGESAKAEDFLKKAIALDNQYIDAYFNLGVLYEKNGDYGSSADAYREFIKRSPDKNSPFIIDLTDHLSALLEK